MNEKGEIVELIKQERRLKRAIRSVIVNLQINNQIKKVYLNNPEFRPKIDITVKEKFDSEQEVLKLKIEMSKLEKKIN